MEYTMEALVAKLNEASDAYYNGKEIMSDHEFDKLFDQLKELEATEGRVLENSPTRNVGAPVADELPKFTHPYPAKSLDKTKDVDQLVNKFRKGIQDSQSDNDNIVLMWKEDGSTVQAYYKDGKLERLVTRGNGEVGSDITHNAKSISGIPLKIAEKGEVVVRGEALISYSEFNKINLSLEQEGAEKFKNPRNLASASIQMLDSKQCASRHVIVKAFNLVWYVADMIHDPLSAYDSRCTGVSWIDNEANTGKFSDRLKILEHLGFNVVEHKVVSVNKLSEAIEEMSNSVEDYAYPVDGLVAAMDNYKYSYYLEGTEHHPNIMQGYALKWEDEEKETILREIEWSPSRTGLLNPVAIFDPVELYGTTVQRASLHNLSIMNELNIRVGDRVTVTKRNMIIPNIERNLDKDAHANMYGYTSWVNELIGSCPSCGTPAEIHTSPEGIDTVYCPYPDCKEKIIGRLAHFCTRDCMDIQGMSEETIKKLVDAGFVREYADFFRLKNKPMIALMPGFGQTSWKKMCESAEKARTTNFIRFFTAMGIPDIGKGQLKTLYKYIVENYDSLKEYSKFGNPNFLPSKLMMYVGQTDFDFSVIDGFGSVLASNLSNWLKTKFRVTEPSPETQVFVMLQFTDERPAADTAEDSAISGKNICITGKLVTFKNRQELVDKIESLGGKWVDSVSGKTDYLINNDTESTSGKNKKAKDLNIPIISEEDFLKMIQ